ncbi:HI0074 family nucleotidyltransferase substrate-binding subunit [Parablautia muri]|uniref:Antitoxin n=1 Tax=Parablautia muri TaxID=2320879 RepID=A0A9X5GSH8_9FIRM|nr:HI0074 family nucleotidyltransferase substrate-binding subunit [Parablautia muri]NBJ91977.1 antitoxin [Parablautia muri]
MERKFMRRFQSYKRSLEALSEARNRDMSDSFVLSGTSAKFSITFDLAWKTMKDILVEYYAIMDFVSGSPREVLKKAFQTGMITGDEWMEMLEIRNRLIHDYEGEIVKEYCRRIIKIYIGKFTEFQLWVESISDK